MTDLKLLTKPVWVRHVFVCSLLVGTAAAAWYAFQGLTLSHYDAKAHLVVARRILDSAHPGWQQIGAVWLPLPHLLNMLPVQNDWDYRTGASAIAMSVVAFALGTSALWWLVLRATRSRVAAWTAAVMFGTQPDVLYLQSTPMTEPLLMGLCLAGTALAWHWVSSRAEGSALPAGALLALACLTRYEAWPITAAAIALAALALLRMQVPRGTALRRTAAFAALPALAVVSFLALSKATVGRWLVTDGFYQIVPLQYHNPLVDVWFVIYGAASINGYITITLIAAATIWLLRMLRRAPERAPLLIVLALGACAVLPLYAFWSGHPYRVRYMVPLSMVVAAVGGLATGLLPRWRHAAAALLIALAFIETPPFSLRSPMVREAQWDRRRSEGRQIVTEYLRQNYDHQPILASMGALAHYMQETSAVGLPLRTYIHEGLGQLWTDSLESAGRHAGWVLLEEQAQGRDPLVARRRESPAFLEGFTRVSEGGGIALYRRIVPPQTLPSD